eukprot:SAG31_NODE_34669_length_330_cov_1.337662_2_plen_42_part_01
MEYGRILVSMLRARTPTHVRYRVPRRGAGLHECARAGPRGAD